MSGSEPSACPLLSQAWSSRVKTKREVLTVKVFGSGRLEIDVDTLDVTLHRAREQSLDRAVGLGPLHLGLELVAQDAVELLHVVLQERVESFPSKRFRQFGRACRWCKRNQKTKKGKGYLARTAGNFTRGARKAEQSVIVLSPTDWSEVCKL